MSAERTLLVTSVCAALVLFAIPCEGRAQQPTDDLTEELRQLIRETTRETSNSMTDTRRQTLARRILESDPENAAALAEIGLYHAMEYRWYKSFVTVRQPIFGGLKGTVQREFEAAVDYLNRAIESDPDFLPAYRELIRTLIEGAQLDRASNVTRRLTQRSLRLPDGWMYRGLLAQLENNGAQAERFFDRGLGLMHNDQRSSFEDVSLFITAPERGKREKDKEEYDQSYWRARDPLYLTDENERRVAHMARLVYAEIWYGDGITRGWETERGKIVARYGIPLTDLSYTVTMTEKDIPRFNILGYGDFHFLFEDQTRGGHYTMYSPKAGAGSGWANDYVIRAGEMARSDPELFRFLPTPRTSVLAQTSAFRGQNGQTELYIHYAIPTQFASLPGLAPNREADIGGFITHNGRVIARSTAVGESRVNSTLDRPHLVGTLTVTLQAGDYGLSVEYLNGDKTAYGVTRDSTSVPSWPDDRLSMSDILIASAIDTYEGPPGNPEAILRIPYEIIPDSWSPIDGNGETLIYFEVYGLSLDASGRGGYHIESRLFKTDERSFIGSLWKSVTGGSADETVTVAFDIETTSSDDVSFFALALSNQKKGSYDLTVKVTDRLSLETVESARTITISR